MRSLLIAISLPVLALGLPTDAWPLTPTEELRRYADHVLRILQNSTLNPPERRAAVREIADEAFDVRETSRRVLGPHWQARTPAERDQFVRVFHDFLEQTYLSRIDLYRGERIRFVNERVDGARAVVQAVIVTRLGLEVPVETRLLRKGGRWQIYDVLIERFSLVANYRSQFDRVIRTESYEELVTRLKARVTRLVDPTPRGVDESARLSGGRRGD